MMTMMMMLAEFCCEALHSKCWGESGAEEELIRIRCHPHLHQGTYRKKKLIYTEDLLD